MSDQQHSQDGEFIRSNTKRVSLANLYLDPNNYRLIHEAEQKQVSDEQIKDKDVANRTFRLLLGNNNQNIKDLIDSFKSNGYLPVDQIQVRELASEKGSAYVVVEGNRRIAALKFLQQEYQNKSIDLGKLDKDIFSRVPVVMYDDPDQLHHLTLMALKHISGNKKWGEWNQAKLLQTMINKHQVKESDVCVRVGISKTELRRNLRALALTTQYQQSDYGDQFSETMFPMFREAVRSPELKDWLKWDDNLKQATDLRHLEQFFSLLSVEEEYEEDDDGDEGALIDKRDPGIVKRDDIRTFAKLLKDSNAMEVLLDTRNLLEAYQASEWVLKDRLSASIRSLRNNINVLQQLAINEEHLPDLESASGQLRMLLEKARSNTSTGFAQTAVYHDRIDDHFKEIVITQYRSLQDLKLDKLSKVNIFAGMNNAGKTTLLEAIYLLCHQNNVQGLFESLRRRGKIQEDHIPAKWLSEQLPAQIRVEGTFDNKTSKLEIISAEEQAKDIDRTHYLKTVEIFSRFDQQQSESKTRIYKGKEQENQSEPYKQLCLVVFSSPFFLNEPHHYTRFYHKSVQSKLLPRVFAFMRERILPGLQDVRLVDEFQRFLVQDDQFDIAMDITAYGEGLQRIFFTSLLFASAQNGVVLIDEFENAIHASLLNVFAPFIHELAIEFNVQVFLTSHSKECIDAFLQYTQKDNASDFAYHALVRDAQQHITVKDFDGEQFSRLLEAGNVDLRKAK